MIEQQLSNVVCNECYEPLTQEEVSAYPLQWQYSGDMYCTGCQDTSEDNQEENV
jgi:hypothetical protein